MGGRCVRDAQGVGEGWARGGRGLGEGVVGSVHGSLSGSQWASDARSLRAFGLGVKGWRSGDDAYRQ